MNTFLVVLAVLAGVYAVGFVAMLAYLRGQNLTMAALWPLTLIWMLIGNVQ